MDTNTHGLIIDYGARLGRTMGRYAPVLTLTVILTRTGTTHLEPVTTRVYSTTKVPWNFLNLLQKLKKLI